VLIQVSERNRDEAERERKFNFIVSGFPAEGYWGDKYAIGTKYLFYFKLFLPVKIF
jgi:hypothetical protein